MPPILVAFFLLLGGLTAPDLVKGLDPRPDRISHWKVGKPEPESFRTWTSRPWIAVSDPQTRTCDATFFALSTRRTPVRLVAGGEEQLLDTSWSFARSLKEGERRTVAFDFRDPEGGASLSCQEQAVTCYAGRGYAEAEEVRKGRCAADPRAPQKAAGKVKLVGYTVPFTMMDPGIGGAYVD